MTLHLPTLNFVSIAMLAMSAGIMTLFGSSGRVYRGFWWWAAAQWLLALGLLLHGMREHHPALLPVAHLLLMQWPIVVLTGMRRFYARHEWRVPAAVDKLLLALAYAAWCVAWIDDAPLAFRVGVFAGGVGVLHLYGAALLIRLPEFRHSSALKALVVTELAAATIQALRVVQARSGAPRRPADTTCWPAAC